MTDYATTGDGLIAGLQFLAAMSDSGRKASDLVAQFEPVPQMLKNVRYAQGADPLSVEAVKAEIARAEARLDGSGRVLIRKSGTEPLIRVMAEAEDEAVLREVVDGIVAAVEKAA
jgi:phosphoglucosamine mutase